MTLTESTGEPAQPASQSIDDASVTAQVMLALLNQRSTRDLKTSVSTQDGVVTISGVAANPAEKETVTRLVNNIYGVKSVINTMEI